MKKIVLSSVLAMSLVSALSADVSVKSKAGVLKFSGEHRLTYTDSDKKGSKEENGKFHKEESCYICCVCKLSF